MNKVVLTAKPLSAELFSPFGDVIEVASDSAAPIIINGGNTQRYDSLAKVELSGSDGVSDANDHAAISIFRAQPRMQIQDSALNRMRIEMMERHPKGSQSFHPLSNQPYLVLVADAVEQLSAENLHLFLATSEQGINYHKNTWHHPVLGLNNVCDFLVVDRKGAGNNCEEFHFDEDTIIEIEI